MSHLVFLARVALAGEGKHSARSIRGLISTKAEGGGKAVRGTWRLFLGLVNESLCFYCDFWSTF
jgi:hypothetical protein